MGLAATAWKLCNVCPMVAEMPTCTGPKCEREAVADGLCDTHRKQKERGKPLAVIRERGNPLVHFATRLPQDTIDALGPEPATKAREVLNSWAERRRRK